MGLVIPLSVAVIAVVPTARVEASPWLPVVLEMVATEVVADAHVTCVVRFAVVPSEYVPCAVNGSVRPLATLGLAGVTAIDCRTAWPTVSVSSGLTTFPSVAVMTVLPVASVVARPWDPPLFDIVATEGVAEAQVT